MENQRILIKAKYTYAPNIKSFWPKYNFNINNNNVNNIISIANRLEERHIALRRLRQNFCNKNFINI